jgi:acyl-coenzyme A thioesterase PaaI-like protein
METKTTLPLLSLNGESDWEPFDAPSLVGDSLVFVSGDPLGERFRVNYFRDSTNNLVARVWFGPGTAGPPGHAHGGSIAAIFDEVLGLAAWAAGHAVVVGNLNVSFRQLLPLEDIVEIESKIISINGRKILVHGRITDGNNFVYAEADCLCITIVGKKPE